MDDPKLLIDPKFHHIFPYDKLNKLQLEVLQDALFSDSSIVLSAPTASGKTVVFEFTIVRLLKMMERTQFPKEFKIIYVAPMKTLCEERYNDWQEKFSPLGVTCFKATGDDNNIESSKIKDNQIIITTPEKWDALTRRWRDNRTIVDIVKLFLIDEVHLLNDKDRGPVLEAIVSRMKTIQESVCVSDNHILNNKIRFIAVSSTVSNTQDIAAWLGNYDGESAICHKFDEEYRSVKLRRIVEGYRSGKDVKDPFKFDLSLNYKLPSIIEKYSDQLPVLIFCNSRSNVELTANALSSQTIFAFSPEQKQTFYELASKLSEEKLKPFIINGVGCHHAGLSVEDRKLIIKWFQNNNIPILVATSTLAMGVNLPAHLVIIKSTWHYVDGKCEEYEKNLILQMMGRAGRPQFNDEGVAVIMTKQVNKKIYENLHEGNATVESNLHQHLIEYLNAEIALKTLTNVPLVLDWMKSTFLYVRAVENPVHYGAIKGSTNVIITDKFHELCLDSLTKLNSFGLILFNENGSIKPTETGILMASQSLKFETMKLILKLKGTESLYELISTLSECSEFRDINLRVNEKKDLNELNKSKNKPVCRFHIPGKISSRQLKINCLIQSYLGRLTISKNLVQDLKKTIRSAEHIVKCIVTHVTKDSFLYDPNPKFQLLLTAIILQKCFATKTWETSEHVERQSQNWPPKCCLNAIISESRKLVVKLSVDNHDQFLNEASTDRQTYKASLIIGDSENNLLFFKTYDDFHLKMREKIKITPKNPDQHKIYVHFVNHSWGKDVSCNIEVRQSQKKLIPENIKAYVEARENSPSGNKKLAINRIFKPQRSSCEGVSEYEYVNILDDYFNENGTKKKNYAKTGKKKNMELSLIVDTDNVTPIKKNKLNDDLISENSKSINKSVSHSPILDHILVGNENRENSLLLCDQNKITSEQKPENAELSKFDYCFMHFKKRFIKENLSKLNEITDSNNNINSNETTETINATACLKEPISINENNSLKLESSCHSDLQIVNVDVPLEKPEIINEDNSVELESSDKNNNPYIIITNNDFQIVEIEVPSQEPELMSDDNSMELESSDKGDSKLSMVVITNNEIQIVEEEADLQGTESKNEDNSMESESSDKDNSKPIISSNNEIKIVEVVAEFQGPETKNEDNSMELESSNKDDSKPIISSNNEIQIVEVEAELKELKESKNEDNCMAFKISDKNDSRRIITGNSEFITQISKTSLDSEPNVNINKNIPLKINQEQNPGHQNDNNILFTKHTNKEICPILEKYFNKHTKTVITSEGIESKQIKSTIPIKKTYPHMLDFLHKVVQPVPESNNPNTIPSYQPLSQCKYHTQVTVDPLVLTNNCKSVDTLSDKNTINNLNASSQQNKIKPKEKITQGSLTSPPVNVNPNNFRNPNSNFKPQIPMYGNSRFSVCNFKPNLNNIASKYNSPLPHTQYSRQYMHSMPYPWNFSQINFPTQYSRHGYPTPISPYYYNNTHYNSRQHGILRPQGIPNGQFRRRKPTRWSDVGFESHPFQNIPRQDNFVRSVGGESSFQPQSNPSTQLGNVQDQSLIHNLMKNFENPQKPKLNHDST